MKPEIFTHYGNRLRTKSKRVYRKSLRTVIKSKNNTRYVIVGIGFYYSEIRLQAKVFKNNINHDFNRFNQNQLWKQ